MKEKPVIRSITIYPVKSLDGISLEKAEISDGGCLLHDREFAIFDEDGYFVNGKSNPLVHSLRSSVDFKTDILSIRHINETSWKYFHLHKESAELELFLSDHFGFNVFLRQNKTGRFLDIPDMSGITLISTSSLEASASWFANMNIDETRRRFRASIEIEGVPAFWEDRLFIKPGRGVEFKLGDVTVLGMTPRARCVVPTRNPDNGEVIRGFQKLFAQHRASSLPEWSTLDDFGHHYYLSVDCFIPETEVGKFIEVGDELRLRDA